MNDYEIKWVNKVERDLREKHNDRNCRNLYLFNLWKEISSILSDKKSLDYFYDYIDLLNRQTKYFSPLRAYLYGKKYYYDSNYDILKMMYLDLDKNLDSQIQNYYMIICNTLDSDKILINKFTESYRSVYGINYLYIDVFINMGIFVRLFQSDKEELKFCDNKNR
jgi:hypothetical protein